MKLLARIAPPLALSLLVILFFHQLVFTANILARGDTFAYFYPYWHARDAALAAGRLPLWTPDLFMGVPLLGNSQLGTFYPPNWLTITLTPPDAIRISIIVHIIWGALGMYVLGRRVIRLETMAALTAALVFALGGTLSARVEQINQLQGLAWLPWIVALYLRTLHRPARGIPWLAAALALQFYTGHTQTVFITGIGLGVLALIRPPRQIPRALIVLALGGGLAMLLALPQLIPTIELASVGNRSGGFNPEQAMAFSFSPFAVGRGLLPSYDGLISTEYIVYPGVIGLALALIGAASRSWRSRLPWLMLAGVGLFFAFGLYNPVYWTLASLPGFNLFRVPARWLALFALGAAVLAGIGVETFARQGRAGWRVLLLIVLVTGGLIAVSPLIARLPDGTPPLPPTPISFAAWIIALIVAIGILRFGGRWRSLAPTALIAALAVELFLASGVLPFNDLTTPEAWHGGRFTQFQVRALEADQLPAGRTLSISSIDFDPGDRAALESRFGASCLSETAIRTAFIAIKLKETLAPNLPLVYGIPSADGFDGGLLPTGAYTAFTTLLLPDGELPTLDGRLREILSRPAFCRGACIPELRWLNLMNVRYLITDKVFDLWHEDVAYDTQFELVTGGDTVSHPIIVPFPATAVDLLVTCPDAAPCLSPAVTLIDADGGETRLDGALTDAAIDIYQRARLTFPSPLTPAALRFESETPITLRAVTLVDTRTGNFQQTTFAPWVRVLSSDIKLYENASVMPRAFVISGDVRFAADDAAALALMGDPAFDPQSTLVLTGAGQNMSGAQASSSSVIREYAPERVVVEVESSAGGWLVLTDAHYPGWQATVNGEPTPIIRADVMFRAVPIPAGTSTVVFSYEPAWLPGALIAGAAAWVAVLSWGAVAVIRRR